MAVAKLLNLLAISCLAIIASVGPTPVAALSVENTHYVRHSSLHHAVAAKKRETSSKRCKPRSTSAAKPTSYAPAPPASPAPTKSASSAPAPKPTNAPSSNGNSGSSNNNNGGSSSGIGKPGIAWANGNEKAIQNFKSYKTQTYYTWSPWCLDDANQVGLNCCPMLWGSKQIGDWKNLVKPGYANCAMGFNEPNQPGQSDMSPQSAADLWWQYLNPLKDQGYMLISPACTNAPSGKQWIQDFLNACKGCQIDRLAMHWYGTEADEMISYIEDFYNTFKIKVWITEFACQNFSGGAQCSESEVWDFMGKVTAWMDKTPYVERYFAFGILESMSGVNPLNQLMTPGGQPNALGNFYIGL